MASFRGYKRQIKLEFDYDEVKKGIPDVKKQMAVLNAEFRKSSAEAITSGKEIDKLSVRYEYLSQKLKIQQQEVEAYRKKLEETKNAQGNNTKAVQNAITSLEIAEAKLGQTRAELDRVTKELEEQRTILGKTSKEWKDLADKTGQIGKDMTMKLTTPILAAGAASFKLGADFEQALGKMEVVFEDNADAIAKWAQNSLRDFGLARSTAIEMASDFGALFKGMGISLKDTEEWSKTLTERTMDLANFYDTTVEETTRALNAIVTGQTEPLRRFGINMTQATLQEYAYANGIRKKVSEMTEAEKVQLRYNYVIEKTNIAVGTTARESDSATGQINRFKESIKELGVNFSEHILPMVTPLIEGLNNIIEKVSNLSDGMKKFIVVAGTIVAVVGPILLILGSVFKAISNISAGMKAAKGALDLLSGAGKLFKQAGDNSAWFGFAKWAVIIAGVALAIGFLIDKLNDLIKTIKGVPPVNQTLSQMPNNLNAAIRNTAIRGYAAGTNYHPGGPAIVGEEGPELLIPPRGSRVISNKDAMDLLGGGDTFILQVKMDEVDEVYKLVNIVKQLKQARRAGVIQHG